MSDEEKRVVPLVVDYVILVCNGCRGQRRLDCDPFLVGAEALIAWMKTKPTACPCGAPTCDVKAHLVEQN